MTAEMKSAMEECIRACMDCARVTEECFGACVAMDMAGMARCIQLCRDCADVCTTNAALMSRGSDYNLCDRCAELAEACAAECERMAALHSGEHAAILRRCAEACRRCAETCRAMAS